MAALTVDLDTMQGPVRSTRRNPTQLERLIEKNGGSYRTTGMDSVFFHLYTGVEFHRPQAEKKNFTICLRIHAPPGAPREDVQRKRVEYWTHSRRLSSGGLLALMLVTPEQRRIFLGTVASSAEDIAESAKVNNTHVELRVTFFDPEVELFALRNEKVTKGRSTFGLLIDNSVMYEALRPFLETLQTVEPTSIPFHQYIASEDSLVNVPVPPPQYSLVRGFQFNLKCLLQRGAPFTHLNTRDSTSIAQARQLLPQYSGLDPSQAQSVVDALTCQITLIQG